MKPSKDDFIDWQNHRVTKWAFEEIELMCRDYLIATGEGGALYANSIEQTSMTYAEAVGFVRGLRALLEIRYREDEESE